MATSYSKKRFIEESLAIMGKRACRDEDYIQDESRNYAAPEIWNPRDCPSDHTVRMKKVPEVEVNVLINNVADIAEGRIPKTKPGVKAEGTAEKSLSKKPQKRHPRSTRSTRKIKCQKSTSKYTSGTTSLWRPFQHLLEDTERLKTNTPSASSKAHIQHNISPSTQHYQHCLVPHGGGSMYPVGPYLYMPQYNYMFR